MTESGCCSQQCDTLPSHIISYVIRFRFCSSSIQSWRSSPPVPSPKPSFLKVCLISSRCCFCNPLAARIHRFEAKRGRSKDGWRALRMDAVCTQNANSSTRCPSSRNLNRMRTSPVSRLNTAEGGRERPIVCFISTVILCPANWGLDYARKRLVTQAKNK